MNSFGYKLVAEVKTKSPFGYQSNKSWQELFDIANNIGDIISIHTDPRWGGSFELLKNARNLTNKPILAKGIHKTDEDIEQALKLGADYVLVVGRIPKFDISKLLIEPNTLKEIQNYPLNTNLVWNSRDLSSGENKSETIEDVRKVWSGWLCQASNIRSKHDIYPDVDAVLIGTNLEGFV